MLFCLFWPALKKSFRLNIASLYLMLVLNLFLSTVSPFGEIVMQDYWMRFFNFKNGVRVLYWVLYFRLEPCHYFWNLSGYPSIKSVLKEDYLCSRKSWIYVHRISSLRNCYLWNTTSLMIQGLGCLIGFLFHVPIAWRGYSFTMHLKCGTMSVKIL